MTDTNTSPDKPQNKTPWIFLSLVLVVSLIGIGSVVYWGLKPRSIPKIKISEFTDLKTLSNSIFMRLNLELKAAPVWVLGVENEDDLLIWKNFLTTFEENTQSKIKERWVHEAITEGMKKHFADDTNTWNVTNLLTIADSFKEFREKNPEGAHAVFLTTTTECSNLVERSLRKKLNTEPGIMAICTSKLVRSREEEKTANVQCYASDENDSTGLGRLGCMIFQISRPFYSKKLTPNKMIGMMNQVGSADYLLLHTVEGE